MIKRLTSIRFEWVLLLVVLAANLHVVFAPANSLMNWYTTDDAFYYFKTAQNFSEGHGISFDQIGRSSGFHPLWMAVCVPVFALARFDLILPLRILALISILLNAGTGMFIYRLARRFLSPSAAMLTGAFWCLYSGIHYVTAQLGMESGISAFFTALLMLQAVRWMEERGAHDEPRRLAALGALAALAVFSRLDNVFLAILLGAWVILRAASLRYLLVSDLLLAALSVFSAFFLRLGYQENYQQYLQAAEVMVLAALVLRPVVNYFAGVYGRPAGDSGLRQALRLGVSVSLSTGVLAALLLGLSAAGVLHGFPRTVLAIDWAFSLAAAFAVRGVFWLLSGRKELLPQAAPETSLKHMWKGWLASGAAYFAPLGGSLAAYMLASRLYFGVFSPVSGQIKHWWGTLFTVYGRPVDSYLAFLGIPDNLRGGPWAQAWWLPSIIADSIMLRMRTEDDTLYMNLVLAFGAVLLLACLGLVIAHWSRVRSSVERMALFPLFAGCLAQVMQYNGTNYVNTRVWYWVTEMLLITLAGGILYEGLLLQLARWKLRPVFGQALSALAALALFVELTGGLLRQIPPVVYRWNENDYLGGMQAVQEVTLPGDLIGSTGGGVIAYFIQGRTVVNLDGLMNSKEYFDLLQARRAHEYLERIGLDYVYGNEYMLTDSEPYMAVFKDRLEKIGLVGGSMLYRYLPGK